MKIYNYKNNKELMKQIIREYDELIFTILILSSFIVPLFFMLFDLYISALIFESILLVIVIVIFIIEEFI